MSVSFLPKILARVENKRSFFAFPINIRPEKPKLCFPSGRTTTGRRRDARTRLQVVVRPDKEQSLDAGSGEQEGQLVISPDDQRSVARLPRVQCHRTRRRAWPRGRRQRQRQRAGAGRGGETAMEA